MEEQMELFEDGGLKDEGGMVDKESGNDVPNGSTKKEVRDDIPAMLSEGEFVLPADVVRYHGLEKIMQLRDEAKFGLKKMEAMGQMGNSDEATLDDDVPFGPADLLIVAGGPEDKPREMAQGGMIHAQAGTFVQPATGIMGYQPSIYQGQQASTTYAPPPSSVAPPTPTPSPAGGYVPKFVTEGAKLFDDGSLAPKPVATPSTSDTSAVSTASTEDKFVPEVQDKYTTLKYINKETGQIRDFYFYNGNPVTPIPDGFIPYDESVDEVVDDLESTTVESTRVIDPGGVGSPEDLDRPEAIDYSTLSAEELQDALAQNSVAQTVVTGLLGVNPLIGGIAIWATKNQRTRIEKAMKDKGIKPEKTEKKGIIETLKNVLGLDEEEDKDKNKGKTTKQDRSSSPRPMLRPDTDKGSNDNEPNWASATDASSAAQVAAANVSEGVDRDQAAESAAAGVNAGVSAASAAEAAAAGATSIGSGVASTIEDTGRESQGIAGSSSGPMNKGGLMTNKKKKNKPNTSRGIAARK
jgi:hypothetical protein